MFEAVLRTDEKDRKVNYRLAGATLPFSVYNTFFIYGVEISGYLQLLEGQPEKNNCGFFLTISPSNSQPCISEQINFRDYLINQKQAIAVDVNPDGHNEIPLSV